MVQETKDRKPLGISRSVREVWRLPGRPGYAQWLAVDPQYLSRQEQEMRNSHLVRTGFGRYSSNLAVR